MRNQERLSLLNAELRHAKNHVYEAITYSVYYDYKEHEIYELSKLISALNKVERTLDQLQEYTEKVSKLGGF